MGSIMSKQGPSMQVALQNVKDMRLMTNSMLTNRERELSNEKLKKIEVDIQEYMELFKEMR